MVESRIGRERPNEADIGPSTRHRANQLGAPLGEFAELGDRLVNPKKARAKERFWPPTARKTHGKEHQFVAVVARLLNQSKIFLHLKGELLESVDERTLRRRRESGRVLVQELTRHPRKRSDLKGAMSLRFENLETIRVEFEDPYLLFAALQGQFISLKKELVDGSVAKVVSQFYETGRHAKWRSFDREIERRWISGATFLQNVPQPKGAAALNSRELRASRIRSRSSLL